VPASRRKWRSYFPPRPHRSALEDEEALNWSEGVGEPCFFCESSNLSRHETLLRFSTFSPRGELTGEGGKGAHSLARPTSAALLTAEEEEEKLAIKNERALGDEKRGLATASSPMMKRRNVRRGWRVWQMGVVHLGDHSPQKGQGLELRFLRHMSSANKSVANRSYLSLLPGWKEAKQARKNAPRTVSLSLRPYRIPLALKKKWGARSLSLSTRANQTRPRRRLENALFPFSPPLTQLGQCTLEKLACASVPLLPV